MITSKDPQQCKFEILSREGDTNQQVDNVQKVTDTEVTPLLGKQQQTLDCCANVRAKFQRRYCLRSKAALLILVWNLIIASGVASFFDLSSYTSVLLLLNSTTTFYEQRLQVSGGTYGIGAILFLFYPLAGYLADVQFGRHRMIVYSLYFIFLSAVVILVVGGPVWCVYMIQKKLSLIIIAAPALGVGITLTLCSLITFSANVIQYGMDQLHDAPSDDLTLYIHWYVWTSYMGLMLIRLLFLTVLGTFLYIPCTLPLLILLLGVTLCLQRYKQHWFLFDYGSRNPYKLVYKVVEFAAGHKNPINRSAFTYCEDELPSRFDLGKEKYGGPFKTEQVEDVKAFLGILSILLTLGPILTVDIAVHGFLPSFAFHIDSDILYPGKNLKTIISNGSLTLLLIVILIPLYLCLLRPFIHDYMPGMLKRMGMGMILLLLSALCTLSMDIYGHETSQDFNSTACVLSNRYSHSPNSSQFLDINLVIQNSLNAIGYMLLYIAAYEFICSQSPHAMKGLLIGTFFAIKGVFQLLGIVIIFAPFTKWSPLTNDRVSCGTVYYLINVVIAVLGIVIYVWTARRYQYRQRDEPDNVYRYADEYYAKSQDEPNYDYDDYNNLNVETIT